MLLTSYRDRLRNNLRVVADSGRENWFCQPPVIISGNDKSERMAHPCLGVIHSVNAYSSVLDDYLQTYRRLQEPMPPPTLGKPRNSSHAALPRLTDKLANFLRLACSGVQREGTQDQHMEYLSAQRTHETFLECPVYAELRQFLANLSSFLNGSYVSGVCCLEPFQQQLIMHTFYFIASIKAPEKTHQLFATFKQYFGLFETTDEVLQTFKQKASVFVIPRRHGKTWIVVAIISVLLASVENIHVGYVAHQKHVANAVFSEVIATLSRWFPAKNLNIKKENGTIVYVSPGRRPSSLMCATCFNKNVSTCSLNSDIRTASRDWPGPAGE
ncbi:ORF29A [macacine gammaherpesvirus 12]|uniref:ORF29A n=1 Tax=macacine gammaherpesvirus 12 TaxID=2560571 RepID=A0A0B5D3K2_9GAMA|nr:ORF29A [Macaca nemestrina rhadinovirus 2]AJE29676.1 ORF29A [Macaca nemestrina rhadinovirus 2]